MYQLELHIVTTSNSQKLLDAISDSLKSLLYVYRGMETFDGAKITDPEIVVGVTEVIDNVQKEPAILPD